ncbi:MAG: sugar phosphate isomerase/epimerase [Lentisphaeria bacterium]|nr:sugar phosphate isomerase/epimerase [Lentisphaeria bacterium]
MERREFVRCLGCGVALGMTGCATDPAGGERTVAMDRPRRASVPGFGRLSVRPLAALGLLAVVAFGEEPARPFFAMDNGLGPIASLEEKAELLAELGYAGIGWRPGRTPEMLQALDAQGLKMFSLYVVRRVEAGKPAVDPGLAREFETLRGRGTIVWYGLQRAPDATDETAVAMLREVAEKAAAAGLPVALYPHTGFYAQTVQDAVRLVRAADHPNLGVSFLLCHFLKLDVEENLEAVLREAAPYLRLVQINGADSGDTRAMAWNRLIQPLGQGSFDQRALLRALDAIGYRGPVGLQCFQIRQEPRRHLAESMAAWKAMQTPQAPGTAAAEAVGARPVP